MNLRILVSFVFIIGNASLYASNEVKIDRNSKIAVIGAGPSGLVAALELQENGYKNITVFEKEDSVGGKVKTLEVDGFKIELGAILTTANYKTINKLAKKFDIDIEVFDSAMMVRTKNDETIPYKGYTGHGFFSSSLGAFNFLWTKFFNKEVSQAGIGFVKNEKVFMPMRDFAEEYNFEAVLPPFELALVGCGYGYMSEVPAIYPLKLMNVMYMAGLKGFVKSRIPLVNRNLKLNNIKRVSVGFQNLWRKVSKQLNVRLSTPVLNVKRVTKESETKIYIKTKSGIEEFDKLIISTNPYNTSKFLDLTPEEEILFSRVQTYNYNITVFRSNELKRQETVFFEENLSKDKIGHILAYTNYYADSNLFVAYQQAPNWETTKEELFDWLKGDLSRLGVEISTEDIITQKSWSYFPHYKEEDLRAGYGERLEMLQGENSTFYTGATMSFETTESVSRYSQELIRRHFLVTPAEKILKRNFNSL